MKNRIIAMVSAVVLSLSTFVFPVSFNDKSVVIADAATDAWGREYEVYGSLKYWDKSDGTVGIVGFDINQSEVTIPDKINGKTVSAIENYAFRDAVLVKEIKLPASVTYIGNRAFYNCKLLESINIPTGVKSIGEYAFNLCYNLKAINIPDTVGSIGQYCFADSGLVNIILPNSVKNIGYRAFFNDADLTTAVMPKSVDSIGKYVFAYCNS